MHNCVAIASYPGLLAPAFVACSTNAGEVLQATNAGARRPGYEATQTVYSVLHIQYTSGNTNRDVSLQSPLVTLINFPAYMYVTNIDQYNTVTEVNKVIASCQVYKKKHKGDLECECYVSSLSLLSLLLSEYISVESNSSCTKRLLSALCCSNLSCSSSGNWGRP